MVKLLTFLLFSVFSMQFVPAQSIDTLSIDQTAATDAKKAKKGYIYARQVRSLKIPPSSDHFKPDLSTTSDQSLLNDSMYVRTFREVSYKRASKHRTVGHYVILGVGVYTGVLLIASLVVLGSLFSKMQ